MEELFWDTYQEVKNTDAHRRDLLGDTSDNLIMSITENEYCKVFCGGLHCKYCNPSAHFKPTEMAINGLYSTWMTKNILATSRPSSLIIYQFDLISQFRRENIKTIINMQSHGEHSCCGNGVGESGYSYEPEHLMKENIFFHNFGWHDYGVGTVDSTLNIMGVIKLALQEGKVAVHCHAGLGRTGVVIACFLIYNNRMNYSDAITYVRYRRPGSIDTSSQISYIEEFDKCIRRYRLIFPFTTTQQQTLSSFLELQDKFLFGFKRKLLKFCPKILHACFRQLLYILLNNTYSKDNCNKIESLCKIQASKSKGDRKSSLYFPTLMASPSCEGKHASSNGDTADCSHQFCPSNKFYNFQLLRSRLDVNPQRMAVYNAILTTHYSKKVALSARKWKHDLNETDVLETFPDGIEEPELLCKLAFDWLHYLKTPVLRIQDLKSMSSEDWKEVPQWLVLFERPVTGILQLVARFIVCLRPLPDVIEEAITERLVGILMHDPRASLCESDRCKVGGDNQSQCDELMMPQRTPIWLNGIFDEQVLLARRLMQELVDYVDTEEGRQHLMDNFWMRL